MVDGQHSCGIWRKSARSGAQSNCVEARFDGTVVWLHNSNNPSPQGPTITITPESWLILLDHVQAGDLTPRRLTSPTLIAGHLLIAFDGEHITVKDNDTPPKPTPPTPIASHLLIAFDGEHITAKDTIRYTLDEWHAFLDGVTHDGEFTLPWLLGTSANV